MTETIQEQPLSPIESLPANSSWWTFFKTDFFGKNYCNFKGRASRSEVWCAEIFSEGLRSILLFMLAGLFINYPDDKIEYILLTARFILSLFFFLPLLALSVRRCHDLNWSGWRLMLIFPALLLLWFKGDRKDNRFGQNIYKHEVSQTDDMHNPQNNEETPVPSTLGKAIFTDLLGNNFFNFRGRTSRTEFCVVFAILTVLSIIIFRLSLGMFACYVFLMIWPLLGIISRRFHDLNMRGYWMFLVIPLIVLPFAKGKTEDNRFGKNIYKTA